MTQPPPLPQPEMPPEEPMPIPYLYDWKAFRWMASYIITAIVFTWIGICVFWPSLWQ